MRNPRPHNNSPIIIGKLILGAVAATVLGLTGCLVGPDHIDPGAPFRSEWIPPLPPGVNQSFNDSVAWWTKFNDPILNSLIVRTAQQNLTLGQAAEKIAEARALRGIARGGLFPDIDGIASYTRRKQSGTGNTFGFSQIAPKPFNYWSSGFDATWEIDVFGAVRRRLQATTQDIEVAIEDHNALMVTLQGEVGANYITVRTYQRRIQFAERNIELQRLALRDAEVKLDAGTVTQLDVEQAKYNLYQTEAALPLLQQEMELAYHRLSALMGEPPSDLAQQITPNQQFPLLPEDIGVGLPIELIRQRPDIRSYERQLAAQAARIGVAVAELYPRFTITGTFSVDTTSFTRWFEPRSIAYASGPGVRWRLLDFGRVRSDIEVQRARWRGLVYAYQNSVVEAAAEVEDSLSKYRYSIQRAQSLRKAAVSARKAAEISKVQYDGGLIPFLTLLDAQRVQAELDDQTASAEGDIYLAVVSLYKALGGGWIDPFSVAQNPGDTVPSELVLPPPGDPNAPPLPSGPNAPAGPTGPVGPDLPMNLPANGADGLQPAEALPVPMPGSS